MLVVLLLLSRMRGNGAWACTAFIISLLLVGGGRRRRIRQAWALVEPANLFTFSLISCNTRTNLQEGHNREGQRLSAGLFSFPLPPSSPPS